VLRVLLVVQPPDGGVYEHVAGLARGLAARGQEVAVAGPLAHRRADLGVEVLPLDLRRDISPRRDLGGALRLAALERAFRPDLVHAHSSKAGVAARAARLLSPRLPVLYTAHGFAFASYFESGRARAAYRAAERLMAPLTTRFVCVCEAEGRLAAQVAPRSRVRVVHNGIPEHGLAPPHPSLVRLRERGPVLGVLTLLRPGKGLETLIDAMPAVTRSHPDASVAIAGGASAVVADQRLALERRAAERGVSDRVHLIGETPGPGPLLAGVDVFVSASWAESFPYSILEAMAARLPVIATDVGGCAEAVEHGSTGLVVPPRDPDALAAAIVELLEDPERRRRMGEAGHRRQRERFTLERMVDGALQVYREVAD
jgi:glycosyltransferase involved in cell wall biosynthesis